MRCSILIPVLCVALAPVATAGENWPQFRGPRGDGTSEANDLPVTWSESENIAWKTPIHGKAWSSPVIWGDQIWMTTATEGGHERYAVCVDRETGKIVHDQLLYTIDEPQFCHVFNSYASPTPVVEQGRVYVHFGSAGTACLDTSTGKVLWSREDIECDHFRGPGSSPILYGDVLVVAYDGYDKQFVVAFDKITGNTVWRRDRNIAYETDSGDWRKAYSTATVIEVDGKPQLVSPSAGATIAYEPLSGDELWRINHGGMNAAARPLFADGRLYISTGYGGFHLFSMKVGGQGDVADDVLWQTKQATPTRSSQLLIDDHIYMVSDAGVASCVDAQTGKTLWKKRIASDCTASPLYAAGRIYFAEQEGKTHVVAAKPKFELLATNELDDGCMASPAVYNNAIYLRTKTHLYRIEK